MKLSTDLKDGSVSTELSRGVYARESLEIAARVFASQAEAYLEEKPRAFAITLEAKKRGQDAAALRRLGGEFLNELLNQEYRRVVGRFNQKITQLILTQTIFAARGGEAPPEPPAAERTPEFQAEVAALMRETAAEIKRTMPKKLPPQGNPLPPAPEEKGG